MLFFPPLAGLPTVRLHHPRRVSRIAYSSIARRRRRSRRRRRRRKVYSELTQ